MCVSLKSLSLWNCTTVGTASYLTADLSVPCAGGQYLTATMFNVIFVVGVVVGWPVFLVWYLRRIHARGRTAEQTVLDRVGFVYAPYRPDYIYWDVLETVRKLYLVHIPRVVHGKAPVMVHAIVHVASWITGVCGGLLFGGEHVTNCAVHHDDAYRQTMRCL